MSREVTRDLEARPAIRSFLAATGPFGDSRLWRAVSFILLITLLGTSYFHYRVGLDWADSIYQVVITLSTVGYESPTRDLTNENKLVIALMIPLGVGSAAYAGGLLVSHLVEGSLKDLLELRKMKKQIAALKGHTIVSGIGGIGKLAARELMAAGESVVCIDRDEELASDLRSEGFLCIDGDATDEAVLLQAGIMRANTLVVALANLPEAVFVTLTGRFLNERLRIVARGSDEGAQRKLRRAGATDVILPSVLGGRRMAQAVVKPNVLDFIELTTGHGARQLKLDELTVNENCSFCEKTMEAVHFRQRYGVILVAVRKSDGVMRFNPGQTMLFEPGDVLVVLGENEDLVKLRTEAAAT